MTQTALPVIQTTDLRKVFTVRPTVKGKAAKPTRGPRQTIEAVKDLTLQVFQGEIFAFLGPNGAGKTTTLRMLATLLTPDGGGATVAGYDLLRQPGEVRKHIGYVGQAGGADDSATGREDLLLQARLHDLSQAEAERRVQAMLKALELEAIADRRIHTYSGGQRRRLELALGLIHQPSLLFIDGPTTGLDPQNGARLWDEVRRLRAKCATSFLTTHYLEEADALADRLAIIDGGQLVAEGTPDALKRQIAGDVITLTLAGSNDSVPQAQAVLAGQPFVREHQAQAEGQIQLYVERGDEALPGILRVLDENGVAIRAVSLNRPSLDDVFLRKTGRSLRESAS